MHTPPHSPDALAGKAGGLGVVHRRSSSGLILASGSEKSCQAPRLAHIEYNILSDVHTTKDPLHTTASA